MDPIKIVHLLGLSEDLSDASKESNNLSDWISRAIHDCKHTPQSSRSTKKPLPTTSQPPTKVSHLDLMVGSVKKDQAAKPPIQEIDRIIANLENSNFKEDIENLRILKFLYQTIAKLEELKSAIQANPSFTFNDLSAKNPLSLLIHSYDKDLSIADLLKNPQELVSGETPILDSLIKELSLSKQPVIESVHQAEQKRIEKAKSLMLKADRIVTRSIESFGILDQTALIEIAKIAAATPRSNLSQYFKKFPISEEQDRVEIAKIAAATVDSYLAHFMENFNITDPKALFDIAKIAATNPGSKLFEYFEKFHISAEKDRIEIAKITAGIPNSGLIPHIEKLRITDAAALTEITKIAAATPNSYLSHYIESLEIADPKTRIEIAKIAAAIPNSSLPENIQNFNIADPKSLVEIAKIAAATPNSYLSDHIQKFKITNSKALFQVAKIDLQTTEGNAKISNYDFVNKKNKFLLVMLQNIYQINKSNIPLEISLTAKNLRPFLALEDSPSQGAEIDAFFANLNQELSSAKNEDILFVEANVQRQKYLYGFLLLSAPNKAVFDSLKPTISKIVNFRNKELAINLAISLSNILSSPTWTKHYKTHIETTYMQLPMVLFTNLALDAEADAASLDLIMERLSHIPKAMRKDEAKLSLLLNPLSLIKSNYSTSSKEKFELVLRFLKLEAPLVNLVKILGVLLSLNLVDPKELQIIDSFEELNSVFLSVLQTKLFHFSKDALIENFTTEYPKISEQLRIPFGLETYAANIGKFKDRALTECLQSFIISLCNHTFKEMRYNAENNPHLKAVDPSILARWKETANHDFDEILPPNLIAVTSDDWQDLFLAGTEVQGSCLHINGSISFTRSLLDYVVNGTNQILAIKDRSTGKIKSRCILRLLLIEDPIAKTYRPVLNQETIYPRNSLPPHHKIALNHMARKRSEELGLELFSEKTTNPRGAKILYSLGGNAPYAYVDTNQLGVMNNGVFSFIA